MDHVATPPPQMPAPQTPQNTTLPAQADTSHLSNTPTTTTPPTPTNFPITSPISVATPSPDPAPSASEIPPPSPGASLDSIVPQNPEPMTGKSVFDQPQPPAKNIYSSSLPSIFFRNLIAGFARALGGTIIYLSVLALISYISLTYFWPEIKPLIDSFQQITKLQTQSTQVDPQQVQQLLNQVKQPNN